MNKMSNQTETSIADNTPTDANLSAEIARAEKVLPMWQIVARQFLEHKAAVIGLIIILFYTLVALFAPVISAVTGLDPDRQNALARYQPPMSEIEVSSDYKEQSITKFMADFPDKAKLLSEEIVAKNLFPVIRAEDALYDFANQPKEIRKSALEQLGSANTKELKNVFNTFSSFHIFGTDELGRDVLIRLIYGTRVSMGVGLMVALASALVGLLIGALAGFHGGWIDTALMRITDSLLSLPTIPILIVVAAIDLDKVPGSRLIISQGNETILKLAVILVLFSWMQVARLVRASVLSLREREFILAARTMGATDTTIIIRHLFPNVIAPLLVSVTLGVGGSILYEAALSFLGLGIQPPMASWGNMLFNAQDLISQAPFLAILPGLQILIVVMSFNYLGDGLQDAIDPKAIKR
jgi:peptide/nickel transport system permease protein